jgi:glycosyltransferase involved in cell wall biosynthesis
LVNSYGIEPGKIDVVFNGVNELYSPLAENEKKAAREKWTGGIPYFVFVGSMHPRKNLSNLLLAFDRFRNDLNQAFKLLIVGEKMFMTGNISKTYSRLYNHDDIVFTGRLSPEKLKEVLGASAGLTFVPLFEGFGIPLLEAMRCEIPILTSNVTSLPEVALSAAIYADPNNVEEIAGGMNRLASDKALRANLVEAGRQRVREFNWDRSSGLLWESICRVIETC